MKLWGLVDFITLSYLFFRLLMIQIIDKFLYLLLDFNGYVVIKYDVVTRLKLHETYPKHRDRNIIRIKIVIRVISAIKVIFTF